MSSVRCSGSTKLESFYKIQKLFERGWCIMSDPYWFHKKWGLRPNVPIDDVYERLDELETKVKQLEEENVELTNELYRLENSLDARIDILAERCRINYDV
jgi:hypothetical protein